MIDLLRSEVRGSHGVTVALVVEEAARAFEKEESAIWGRDRQRVDSEMALVRSVVWAVAYDLVGMSWSEMSRLFGRSYSTLIKGSDRARANLPDVVRRFRSQVLQRGKELE